MRWMDKTDQVCSETFYLDNIFFKCFICHPRSKVRVIFPPYYTLQGQRFPVKKNGTLLQLEITQPTVHIIFINWNFFPRKNPHNKTFENVQVGRSWRP